MPILTISQVLRPTISFPIKRILPASGFRMPVISRNNVVLPAPFGPIRPRIWALSMENPMSLTARRPPKFLVSPLIVRKDWVISSLFRFFPQLPARNFSHIRLRELAPAFDTLGNFLVGEILFAKGNNFFFRNFAAG